MSTRLAQLAAVLVSALCVAPPALAHGGKPRLEISPERLNPGAALSIRGVEFSYEDDVELVLAGHSRKVGLGHVTADDEGVFSTSVVLPVGLGEGVYTLRAVTEHHKALSPPIGIAGTAAVGGEEGSRRDEEDSLLAPMPTAPLTPAAPVAAPAEEAGDEARDLASVSTAAVAGAALCVLAGAVIAYRRRGRCA